MSYFEQIAQSAERIARQCKFPGKRDKLELCEQEIEDLAVTGQITPEQRDSLRAVLAAALVHRA